MNGLKLVCVVLIAALVLCGLPQRAEAKISESSSEGAAITVGLFAVVVAVLFIIGFKSDMDNVFAGNKADDLVAYAREEPPGIGVSISF